MIFITTFLVAMFTYLVVRTKHSDSGAPGRFPMRRLIWRSWIVGSFVAAGLYDLAQLMNGHLLRGLIDWLRYLPRSFLYIWLWYVLFRYIDNCRQAAKSTTSTDVVPYSPTEPFEGR